MSASVQRALVLGLVVAVLLGAWRFGVFERLADAKVLAQTLVELGGWGFLVFVLAYTVLHPFGVPGTVFIVAAPLIWPWKTAFALSMTGTMAATVVAFSFARFMARDWVSARIPTRLRKYDEQLRRNAFQTVVLLRLVLWMPQPLHWFFGLSKVSFSTHFWGSLIGYAPPLLAVSFFASEMFDATGHLQPAAWPIMAGLLVASLVVAALARAWERRNSPTEGATP